MTPQTTTITREELVPEIEQTLINSRADRARHESREVQERSEPSDLSAHERAVMFDVTLALLIRHRLPIDADREGGGRRADHRRPQLGGGLRQAHRPRGRGEEPMSRKRRQHYSTEGFRPSVNPERAHWMRELRKSSATQSHTPKPRKGTRRERERQAIRDQNRGDQR